MSSEKKPYFLRHLKLHNFMLHRDSSFDLSTHPIILITGANGSGKTQVLDAFILALGEHPKRLKKGKVTDIIGSFDKNASVELTVGNPKVGDERILRVPDRDLSELVDADVFSIVVTAQEQPGDEQGVLNYYIQTQNKLHKVLRRDIRTLLNTLNIHAENKLAFTEEGTVTVFSDQSDKNKLDLLLETTGLTTYRENIAATMDNLEKAARSMEPLRRKLSLEKEYLQSMHKAREMARQKQNLVDKYQKLVLEEAWSHVASAQKELEEDQAKLEKKQREYQRVVAQSQSMESDIEQYEDTQKKLDHQKLALYREIEKWQKQTSSLEGENNSNERVIQNLEKKQLKFQERLDHLQNPNLILQRNQIKNDIEKLGQKKQRMQEIKQKLGDHFFTPETAQQRALFAQILQFYDVAREKKIPVQGPLFNEITLDSKAPVEFWQAICQTLGIYLVSFITSQLEDFQAALSLMRELWQNSPPSFFILYCEETNFKKNHPSLKMLQAPALICHFISHVLKMRISDEQPCDILKNVQQLEIVWSDGYVYLPCSAAGGGWVPSILRNGLLSLEDIRDALEIEQNYYNLVESEKILQDKYDALEQPEELHYAQEQIEDCRQNILELQTQISRNNEKISQLQREIVRTQTVYDEVTAQAKEKQEFLQENLHKWEDMKKEEEVLEKNINFWQQSKEEHLQQLQELQAKAQQEGDRPNQVRAANIVAQERSHLQGKLEALEISPVVEEDYLAQCEQVKKLEQELAGSTEHLGNLKVDVDKRFAQWHLEVAQRVKAISQSMNNLMSGTIQGIRLRIDNLKDPSHAGLCMEVKRHAQRWHDLSHLSGGEKVLTVEALILSLHLQADSPIHAIDECTQRLDMKFKAQAFEMVQRGVMEIEQTTTSPFAPQFILLAPDTLGVEFSDSSHSYFKQIILAPAHVRGSSKGKHVKVM